MAISFTEVTVGGKTKDAIVLSGSGEEAVVIFKEALSSFDLDVFEKINDFQILDEDEQPTLTTFKEKYDAFVLSNGIKASELYAPLERVVSEVDYIYKLIAAGRLVPTEVLKIQEDLATCESGDDQVIPVVRSVELPEGGDVVLAEGETFQYGVQVDGEGVAALELDILIANPAEPLRAKEQFTVYASEENPYGDSREKFEAMGVSVVFVDGSWSIDFGPQVTAALAASGEVRIYSALRDDARGKLWGDMMSPTAEMLRKFNISFE